MDFGGFSLFCSLRFRLNLVQNTIKAATSTLTVKDEDNMYRINLFINYIGLLVINQLEKIPFAQQEGDGSILPFNSSYLLRSDKACAMSGLVRY
ncbi:MAG: hypothetical protein K0R47_2104 [Brevibacillus sp.]|nr:hypothetical protein [Brevibacillus sp.]